MFVLLLAVTILCGELLAEITTTGSVDAPYDDTDPWVVNIGDEFIVGFEADGSLSITGGSGVTTNSPTYVGDYAWEGAGTTGTLFLSGLGSTFTVDPLGESEFFIGPFAEGHLTVADQAILTSHDSIIGGSPEEMGDGVVAGTGYATVTGGGQWNTGWLTVGAAGLGQLTAELNGLVTSDTGEIGLMPDGVGEVFVDQSGSWSLNSDLIVGVWGQGAMEISGGGQVTSGRGWIGGVDPAMMNYGEEPLFAGLGDPNGTGEVTVTGSNSLWNAGDVLVVGAWGTGTLDVNDQGTVTAAEVYIGGMPIQLAEGEEFSRDMLPNGTGTVTVSGEGSLLEVTGIETLYVGYSGTGTLNVEAGGDVATTSAVVGGAPGSVGTIEVTGAGSELWVQEEIEVGAWGTGDLIVSDGGTVSTLDLYVGGFDATDVSDLPQAVLDDFGDALGTGTVTVTGADSLLDVSFGEAYIGNYGTGFADVNDGGTVITAQTALGVAPGSYGEVTVDGVGSSWQVSINPDFEFDTGLYSGVMVVGGYGEGLFTVSNGANATVDDVVFIGGYPFEELGFDAESVGYEPNGVGTIRVTGSGSTLETNGIHVGDIGQGTLEVLNGGQVIDEVAMIGVGQDSVGAVLVDGAGSLWQNTAGAFVGGYGQGTVTVSGGGRVDIGQALYIGGFDPNEFELDMSYGEGDPNGTGTVTVTGTGSLVEAFAIGVGATGDGTLEILDGAQVKSQVGLVGIGANAVGTVTVDGDGSTWRLSGDGMLPALSELNGEGTLVVSNGGLVDVNGVDSILAVADEITVGSEGEGTLTIVNGGRVVTDSVILGGTNPDFESIAEYMDPNAGLGTGTGAATVSGAGSVLQAEDVHVGFSGTGDFTIENGGEVVDYVGWIGVMPDAVGTALVTGTDSVWTNMDNLVVGAWGQGDLTIAGGAYVSAPEVYIGGMPLSLVEEEYDADLMPDGTGTVTVTGAGSELDVTSTTTLYVGYSGTGTLDVNDGGSVTADNVVIGATPDAIGTVTVSGSGSTLMSEDIQVGAWGTGNLAVSDQGGVSAGYLAIGGFDASDANDLPQAALDDFGEAVGSGAVTVTGAGSTIETQILLAGVTGIGNVGVSAGGSVSGELGVVGLGEGSTGLVTVTGANSVLRMEAVGEDGPDYGVLAVGGWGTGQVAISAGGLVDSSRVYIGGLPPEELTDRGESTTWGVGDPNGTGTVLVTGAGSRLNVSGDLPLMVGYSGTGTLTAGEGGLVETNTLMIGAGPDVTGTVTIDGAELSVASDAMVGGWGQGNLTVSSGGQASVGALLIGGFDGNDAPVGLVGLLGEPLGNGTVAVTGTGSLLQATGDGILVGFSGEGTLEILNGGQVNSHVGIVGVQAGSTGQVTVDGPQSLWRVTGSEASGLMAEGEGELVISNGGSVIVEDPNAMLDVAGAITVGSEGDGSSMTVSGGGVVYSDQAAIASLPGSQAAATIDGENSAWNNTGDMFVGGYGTGELTISGGGLVDINQNLYIGGFDPDQFGIDTEAVGYDPNGTGTVTVTGEGSTLYGTGLQELYVGYSGNGTLNVEDGGYVESGIAAIGALPGSVGQVTVSGDSTAGGELQLFLIVDEDTPSTWENSGSMVVGGYGDGSLTVSNGGEVYVGDTLYIGGFDIGQGFPTVADVTPNGAGEVTVTGEGSLLVVGGNDTLHVGYSGEGRLSILDQGQVSSLTSFIGSDFESSGQVDVNNGTWTNNGDMYVAKEGQGALRVANGGQVDTGGTAYVAFGTESGGYASVSGEGSRWGIGESLFVGGHGEGSAGSGILEVLDGGEVFVGGELYVWQTGRVEGDGTITVMTPTTVHNYGTIAPGDDGVGTLTVNASVVFHEGSTYAVDISNTTADRLMVDGGVTIEGGAVQVASAGTIMGEHEYEIISADSVTGEFDDLDTALLDFSFSEIGLDYNDASVWLHVAAANFNDPNIAQTDNQRAVAGALQNIGGEGGNGVTDAVQDLETPDDVRNSYDQLSGQTRPALAPMTIAGSSKFLGTVSSRVQTVKNGLVAGAFDSRLMASAGPDQAVGGSTAAGGQTFAVGNGSSVLADKRWGLWGRGYGLFGDRDSEGGVPGYGYNVYGGSFGVDYQFTETLLAGLVGGMSEGDVDFDRSRDSSDFDASHIGLYGSLAWDSWSVDSVFTYASLDYETRRFVDLLDERLSGNFDGSELAAYMELSRDCDLAPSLTLSPLASLQYTYVDLDSYTETGGASALSFDKQTHESVRGSLGARLTKRLIETAGDFQTDVQLRGRWVHEFGDEQASVDSSFASDPAVVFTVKDGEISRDSAVLGAGLCAEMNRQTRVYVDYDTRLNSDESLHVLSASLQYRW